MPQFSQIIWINKHKRALSSAVELPLCLTRGPYIVRFYAPSLKSEELVVSIPFPWNWAACILSVEKQTCELKTEKKTIAKPPRRQHQIFYDTNNTYLFLFFTEFLFHFFYLGSYQSTLLKGGIAFKLMLFVFGPFCHQMDNAQDYSKKPKRSMGWFFGGENYCQKFELLIFFFQFFFTLFCPLKTHFRYIFHY